MRKLLLACLLILLYATGLHAQALAPSLHPQFFTSSGQPLAGGFLYSYAAGTSTFQATYADSGLTIQNANPIPLDATGSPSNGSGAQIQIWLSNTSYKFCAYNSAMVQQWCVDNITTYLGLLNQANTWTFPQTFTQVITDLQTDNQLIFGAVGNQTTLDLPPPAGNITIHMPNTSDTLVGRNTTDTLTNKTLITPTLTNPVLSGVNAQIGTSYTVAATDVQRLVTFNNASPVAVALPAATTAGFGNGTKFSFKNLGIGPVTITPTTSTIDGTASLSLPQGQGDDIYSDGTNYSTQPGRSSNTGLKVECVNMVPVTVANTTATTILQSCTIPANDMGAGQVFEIEAMGGIGSTTSTTEDFTLSLEIDGGLFVGGSGSLVGMSFNPSSLQGWSYRTFITITAAGTAGNLYVAPPVWASSPTKAGFFTNGNAGVAASTSVNTTIPHTIALYAAWTDALSTNTITGLIFVVKRVN